MTTHPGLERLRALTAGELSGDAARAVAGHVADCDACRATTDWLDDMRAAAREPLPRPAGANWERIAARVEAGDVVLLPLEPPRHGGGRIARIGLRVAGIALLLAGGAVAALPNGWVRTWIGEVLDTSGEVAADAAAADAVPADPPAHVMLVVEPRANGVLITMEHPDAAVIVRVHLGDGDDVEVHASGGAAAAKFRTAPGRLAIAEAGAGEIVLAIPRSLARVRFEVDERAYLIKEHDQIRILAPAADTSGSEFILQVRPRPAAATTK